MTDVNEQSFSAGTKVDSATAHSVRSLRSRITQPIWRLRPTFQSVAVVKTLKAQIIPKIVLALRSAPTPKVAASKTKHALSDVEKFAVLALGSDDDAALIHVEGLVADGVPTETIFLSVLAPAARYFGELWETDATDFVNVAIAMSRLQRILRVVGARSLHPATGAGTCGSAILTTVPGEQHSFGLSIVAEFFREAGWNLCTGPFASHRELTSLVHNHWFDIVGFSVSSTRNLDQLKRNVDDIRRDSRNKSVGIILGGPTLVDHPQIAALIGADMISVDAITAPQQARCLIDQMRGRG